MLLLMSLYGLGAGEVTGLQLEDVDWRGNKLRITRRKTGKEIILPLLPAVAEALAEFLKHGRPNHTSSRAVFVQMRAPYQAMDGSSAIRHRIVEYAKRAGVCARYLGSHVLRHSHATRQIELGVPVKAISDILGHVRPETTSRYTRSAVTALRRISLPVPS
jgi:integrase